MSKIPEHKALITAWREQVMQKTKGKCAWCGREATEAHHIITKGSSTWVMEYDVQNGIGLCNQHHRDIHQGGRKAGVIKTVINSHLMLHHDLAMSDLKIRSRKTNQKRQWAIDDLVEKLQAKVNID